MRQPEPWCLLITCGMMRGLWLDVLERGRRARLVKRESVLAKGTEQPVLVVVHGKPIL